MEFPTPKRLIDRAFERSQKMQSDVEVTKGIKRAHKRKLQQLQEQAYPKSKENADKFFETDIQESIDDINKFLTNIGIDAGHTIFAGGYAGEIDDVPYFPRNAGYVTNPSVNRLLPNKYFDQPELSGFTSRVGLRAIRNSENGTKFFNLAVSGNQVSIRKKDLLSRPDLYQHEVYHNYFYGASNYAIQNIDLEKDIATQREFIRIVEEGTVELLKKLTKEYCHRVEKTGGYNGETQLMQHLLFEVIKSYSDSDIPYIDGVKDLVTWASTGGTNTEFVKRCKEVRTKDFPNGFDIYDPLNISQDEQLTSFLNKYKNVDQFMTGPFIRRLKKELFKTKNILPT